MKLNFIYKGSPLTVGVWWSQEPIEACPVVFEDSSACGLGIISKHNEFSSWGLYCPRDPISAWRGCQILYHIDKIESDTFSQVYFAAKRILDKNVKKNRLIISKRIGSKMLNKIMTLPVPQEIVEAIIQSHRVRKIVPSHPYHFIFAEIAANTIRVNTFENYLP